GDGSVSHAPSAPGDAFPEGGTYKNPNHQYNAFQVYDVRLTVSTDDGCIASKENKVVILDYNIPTPTNGYFTDFEAGEGSWVSLPIGTGANSWQFGQPDGNTINAASSGINAWWTGSHTDYADHHGTYFRN